MSTLLEEGAGWDGQLRGVTFSSRTLQLLPSTADRFDEARFFAYGLLALPSDAANLREANWLLSAFLSAVIGIRDAARTDFRRGGKATRFETSELAREFFLPSDAARGWDRDPLAISRAWRDLRNLRVHHAIPLVALRTPPLLPDIDRNPLTKDGAPRWFLRPIDPKEHRLLDDPPHHNRQLSESELIHFNDYVSHTPLAQLLCQHLVILARVIDAESQTGAA